MTYSLSDPAAILTALIQCPSVTPKEAGALDVLEHCFAQLNFEVSRPVFSDEATPDIENLYARIGTNGPHLMFAGHCDVVPVGDETSWRHPPFSAHVEGDKLYGRGAVDMKGAIAAFCAAVSRFLSQTPSFDGSISFLITGDEEGPAINGTIKLLEWGAKKGEQWDASLVGEPTNPANLGDAIKIGRRGSLTGKLTIHGQQGHVAYPHLADNPARGLLTLAPALIDPPLDAGSADFSPSNLEITTMDIGNCATNVIAEKASAVFNIRFNDNWSVESLKSEILQRLTKASTNDQLRSGRETPIAYDVEWLGRPSDCFLTHDSALIDTLTTSIESVTGKKPELSTAGGTSDARFIKDYCPVVEFGLVGSTMHMVDEHTHLSELEQLTQIYLRFIGDWFAAQKGVTA